MSGSKLFSWIFPIIVLITLIAVVWLGILQYRSNTGEEVINTKVMSGFIE